MVANINSSVPLCLQRICWSVCIHVYMCVCAYAYVCMYACMYVYIKVCVLICRMYDGGVFT